MDDQFKDFEKDFYKLKEDYKEKKISEEEYRARLKSLHLRDQKGRSWTIGAQSGKWYCYDGTEWLESKPPSLQDKRAICIYCGFENDLEAEVCVNCGGAVDEKKEICADCGRELDPASGTCLHCAAPAEKDLSAEDEFESLVLKGTGYRIRSLDLISLFFFVGGIGCIFGIVLGAFAGTTNFFPGIETYLPSFLAELQGGLFGGIVYSLIGGILSFILLGLLGFFLGLLMNAVSALFGGIRVKINRVE